MVRWDLADALKKQKISKNKLATLLKTSRSQVDRLLDPNSDITLGSPQRAAGMLGGASFPISPNLTLCFTPRPVYRLSEETMGGSQRRVFLARMVWVFFSALWRINSA